MKLAMPNTSRLLYTRKEQKKAFANLWSLKCDNALNKDDLWNVLLIESAIWVLSCIKMKLRFMSRYFQLLHLKSFHKY